MIGEDLGYGVKLDLFEGQTTSAKLVESGIVPTSGTKIWATRESILDTDIN